MLDIFSKLFQKDTNSKDVAKERLRLVLIHDRANMSPELLQSLKEDLITVINKYLEVDQEALEVNLSNVDDSVALVANIPIVQVKRSL